MFCEGPGDENDGRSKVSKAMGPDSAVIWAENFFQVGHYIYIYIEREREGERRERDFLCRREQG